MAAWKVLLVALSISLVVGCTPGTRLRVVKKPPKDPYAMVQPGMTETEVVTLMGKPSKRAAVELEGGLPGFYLRWVGAHELVNIYFLDGRVASKEKF